MRQFDMCPCPCQNRLTATTNLRMVFGISHLTKYQHVPLFLAQGNLQVVLVISFPAENTVKFWNCNSEMYIVAVYFFTKHVKSWMYDITQHCAWNIEPPVLSTRLYTICVYSRHSKYTTLTENIFRFLRYRQMRVSNRTAKKM